MKIDFEYETQYGKFADSLWFPDGEPLLSDEEIEAMKQQRLNNWLAILHVSPELPEPDLVEIDGVQYEKILIDNQVVLKPVGA